MNLKDGRVIVLEKSLKIKPHACGSCNQPLTEAPKGSLAMVEAEPELFNNIQVGCACGSHSTIFWDQVEEAA